ncbi:hypothetical protein D3C86_1670040 [compost metagenome]
MDAVIEREWCLAQFTPDSCTCDLFSGFLGVTIEHLWIGQDFRRQEVVDDGIFEIKHLRDIRRLHSKVHLRCLRSSLRSVDVGNTAFMRSLTKFMPPFDRVADDSVMQITQVDETRGIFNTAFGIELSSGVIFEALYSKVSTVWTIV